MIRKILALILLIFIAEISYVSIPVKKADMKPTVPSVKVTATMYNAVKGQCDSDPLITAGNYKINPKKASQHKWIAMSRDLLKRWGGEFDYGDMVKISNAGHKNGIYKVVDTMNKRFKKRIDFLETKGTKLYKYKNVTVEKVIG